MKRKSNAWRILEAYKRELLRSPTSTPAQDVKHMRRLEASKRDQRRAKLEGRAR